MSHQHVTRALDYLTDGLGPYVEKELRAVYKEKWVDAARSSFRSDRKSTSQAPNGIVWDAHALLTVMWDQWNGVFRHKLGFLERSIVSELREFRNRWAHQMTLNFDDSFRILDSVHRLLDAIGAPNVGDVANEKRELLRDEFSEEANAEAQRIEFAKDRRSVMTVYAVCCVALVSQLLYAWGIKAWVLAISTIFFFAFLIYKRLKRPMPAFGPRECARCRKIIYSTICPYCEGHISTKPSDSERITT